MPSPFFLDVVLYPYRSLSSQGFMALIAAVALVSFAMGLIFASMGAWPVSGFFGLNLALLYLAFRLSYRSARLREIVRVTRHQLTVCRVQPDGRQQVWSFEPAWARVELHRPEEHDCLLEIASSRRRLIIGAFLPPQERVTFADTLRGALCVARTYREPCSEPRLAAPTTADP